MFDVIELFHPRFAEDAKLEDGVPVPVDAQTDTATRYDGSDVGFSRLVDRVEDVIAEVLVEVTENVDGATVPVKLVDPVLGLANGFGPVKLKDFHRWSFP